MNDRRPSRHQIEARRNAGTCLAMFGLLAIATGLFALAVVVMPDLAMGIVVLGVLVGFMLFHYVTWGWFLSRRRPGDERYDEPEQDVAPYRPVDEAAEFGDD
jgi:hypothetical protein